MLHDYMPQAKAWAKISRTTQCNKYKNSMTDAEQQTQQRRIQFMYTPCDLLKAL